MKRRAYRSLEVKDVLVEEILRSAPAGAASVGLDIGKHEVYAVVRWKDGSFERPWKARNPSQLEALVGLLRTVGDRHALIVAMESTGTYGDALRAKLDEAGLEVHRVGGKAAHDYAEVFDGVPSQHDGKDAAVIAELAAFGKSRVWHQRAKSESDAEMAYWVDWLDAQQSIQQLWTGRLESRLARHWPEASRLLGLSSVTLLKALSHYGGPSALAKDPSVATGLASWGRVLKKEKIEKLITSASQSVGVRQGPQDVRRLQQCATMALSAYRETQAARRNLQRLAKGNEVIQRQSKAVGEATACVLWVALGDPRDYPCGEAYRKAMGLNLKECSSGKHQGQLKITKRGPPIVRRWMYFAAMRTAQSVSVKLWFEAKKAKDKDRSKGALIAVARKLALALHAVGARETPFEPWRLCSRKALVQQAQQAQRRVAVETAEDCVFGMGALPPNPRDLSLDANPGESGTKERGG